MLPCTAGDSDHEMHTDQGYRIHIRRGNTYCTCCHIRTLVHNTLQHVITLILLYSKYLHTISTPHHIMSAMPRVAQAESGRSHDEGHASHSSCIYDMCHSMHWWQHIHSLICIFPALIHVQCHNSTHTLIQTHDNTHLRHTLCASYQLHVQQWHCILYTHVHIWVTLYQT